MYFRLLIMLVASVTLTSVYYQSHYSPVAEGRDRLRLERETQDPRIVRLEINQRLCSGFIVGVNLIATAAHCVIDRAPLTHAMVDYIDGTTAPFKVISRGGVYAGHDWALLRADTGETEALRLNIVSPVPGAMVASIGHPHGVRDQWMTFGMVMQTGKMLVLAEINYPGESGSPIIDQDGTVVGILSAVNVQAPVAYVTPIDVLANKMVELELKR